MSNAHIVTINEQKIEFFSRFIGEKSVFGGMETILTKKKSEEKKAVKIGKNRRFFAQKSKISNIFPKKFDFFLKFGINYILGH